MELSLIDFLKNFRYPEIDLERHFDGYVLRLYDCEIDDYASQGYIVFENESKLLETLCTNTVNSIIGGCNYLKQINIDDFIVDFPHQTGFSRFFADEVENINKYILADKGLAYMFSVRNIPVIDKGVLIGFLWKKCIQNIVKSLNDYSFHTFYISNNSQLGINEIFLQYN